MHKLNREIQTQEDEAKGNYVKTTNTNTNRTNCELKFKKVNNKREPNQTPKSKTCVQT